MKKATIMIGFPTDFQESSFKEINTENYYTKLLIGNISNSVWNFSTNKAITLSYSYLENLIKYEKNIFIPHTYGLFKVLSLYTKLLKNNGYKITAIIEESTQNILLKEFDEIFDEIRYIKQG